MQANFTTLAFLDDLKQGWGVKYGPILKECGLDDLDDAQDLSEGELDGLLGGALRAKGAPSLHVARIVKRLYLANSSNQGKLFAPFLYICNTHTQQPTILTQVSSQRQPIRRSPVPITKGQM
jgi:hypothetical protein